MGSSFHRSTGPARSSSRGSQGHSLLWASTCFCMESSRAQLLSPFHICCGPPWDAGAQVSHHGLHHGLWGKSQLWHLEHCFPSFCTNLQSCSSHVFLLLVHSNFPHFLNILSQRCCIHRWSLWPWAVASLPWSLLALLLPQLFYTNLIQLIQPILKAKNSGLAWWFCFIFRHKQPGQAI